MHMSSRLLCLGLLALALSNLANPANSDAKNLTWPGIIGEDDREVADSSKAPWRSVGRIAHAGFRDIGSCTGTLISPMAVATAAHCFFHPRSHAPLPLGNFRFILGLARDKNLGISRVKCIKFHPDNDPQPNPDLRRSFADSAIVILETPQAEAPIELAADSDLTKGTRVSHAGYGRDRLYALSVHNDCRIIQNDGNTVLTDCDTNLGQSGGPVLVERDGATRLAAIMTGAIENRATAASGVSAWRNLTASLTCPSEE